MSAKILFPWTPRASQPHPWWEQNKGWQGGCCGDRNWLGRGWESNVVRFRVQRCVHLSKLMHSCMRHTVFPKAATTIHPPHTSYKVPSAFTHQGVGCVPSPWRWVAFVTLSIREDDVRARSWQRHARVLALSNVAAVQRGRQSLSTTCKGSTWVCQARAPAAISGVSARFRRTRLQSSARTEPRQAAPPTSARRTVTSRICDCYTQGMDCRVTRYTATDNGTNTLSSVIDVNY